MSDTQLKQVNMTRQEWNEYKDLRILYNTMKADLKKYKTNTNTIR